MSRKPTTATTLKADRIVLGVDDYGPFVWDAMIGDEIVSSHQTVEEAMRAHPMAHVSRASWDAYVLARETAMAGRMVK